MNFCHRPIVRQMLSPFRFLCSHHVTSGLPGKQCLERNSKFLAFLVAKYRLNDSSCPNVGFGLPELGRESTVQRNSKLIDAALSGDHSAFARLVGRYERLVWTICWHILRDYHATQDVTQEAFLVAHRRLSELRQPDSFGSWDFQHRST